MPTNQPIHLIHNLDIWDIFWPDAFHRYNEIHFLESVKLIFLVPALSFICFQLKERIALITDTAGILLDLLTHQWDKCHLINVFFVIALYCGTAVLKLPVSKSTFELDIESCLSAALSSDWISHGYYFSNAAILHLGPGHAVLYGFVLSHIDIKTLPDFDRTPLFVSY